MRMFAGIRRLIASSSSRHSARSQSRRRMYFEPLEARRLLATDLGSITGTVFSDQTDDGLTLDDILVPGVSVHLYLDGGNGMNESMLGVPGGDDTFIGTDPTDVTGQYRFNDLVEGTYFVEEEVPPGLIARTNANVRTVVLDAGRSAGIGSDRESDRVPHAGDAASAPLHDRPSCEP